MQVWLFMRIPAAASATASGSWVNPLDRSAGLSAGIYGSQGRADFTVDDVEHYFNYMGMLAVEGTYDRMEEMLSSGSCCDMIGLQGCCLGRPGAAQHIAIV